MTSVVIDLVVGLVAGGLVAGGLVVGGVGSGGPEGLLGNEVAAGVLAALAVTAATVVEGVAVAGMGAPASLPACAPGDETADGSLALWVALALGVIIVALETAGAAVDEAAPAPDGSPARSAEDVGIRVVVGAIAASDAAPVA